MFAKHADLMAFPVSKSRMKKVAAKMSPAPVGATARVARGGTCSFLPWWKIVQPFSS